MDARQRWPTGLDLSLSRWRICSGGPAQDLKRRDVGISLTREKDSVLLKFVPGLVLPWDLLDFWPASTEERLLFQKDGFLSCGSTPESSPIQPSLGC